MNEGQLYTNEMLDLKRLKGDREADDFISHVFSDADKKKQLQKWMAEKSGPEHLTTLTRLFPHFNFIDQADQLPSWADRRLMRRGTSFFARHSEIIMSLLGLLSLPYCYTGAKGAMVLYLSEMIRKQTSKRLHDTANFVWEVMNPDGFGNTGNAFDEILKVRIMHAAVRYYTCQTGKWTEDLGIPVNQEDMAGTNLSFSLIVIRGLRMMGYNVSQGDQAAFMHIWAVVGSLTGLDRDLLPDSSRQAMQLDAMIKGRQFQASGHGRELTSSLTSHILMINNSKASSNDILGLMRYLLGTEIADMLAIEAPNLPAYKLTLLKTMNFLKGLKPERDTRTVYHQAYARFKWQSSIQ